MRSPWKKGAAGIRNPTKVIDHFITPVNKYARMRWYRLTSDSYPEAYRKWVEYRIESDGPREAVGGEDLGIGDLQFDFMTGHGLTETSTLLDLGCGTLRGGQFYIDFLEPGHYVGIDLSRDAIESGKELLPDRLLREKSPTFYVNDDLKFQQLNREFDFIIAQSVFTHLPKSDIVECFENVDKILSTDGVFYATYFDNHSYNNQRLFWYEPSWIEATAESAGLRARTLPEEEYPHPRNQRMLELMLDTDEYNP